MQVGDSRSWFKLVGSTASRLSNAKHSWIKGLRGVRVLEQSPNAVG